MPGLRTVVECLGKAICDCAPRALAGREQFDASLMPIASAMHHLVTERMTPSDVRHALRELVSSPPQTVEFCMQDGVAAIQPQVAAEFRDSLFTYLDLLQEVVQQVLRRPGDPDGTSVPETISIRSAEDWLLLLPDRFPIFRPSDQPENLDNWRLEAIRGFGPYSEVWDGYDDDQPDINPACLKFITDPLARESITQHVDQLKRVLDLEPIAGLIPLRSAYIWTQVPCFEYVHLPSYDLASLMNSARWKQDRPRSTQSTQIIRRVAQIVGRIHRLDPAIVHRGLKPSNILLFPTDSGGVSVWVSDIGWGHISASLPARKVSTAQVIRTSLRGSFGPLYASPQQLAGAPPDPRDDVYSLGVIWFQLLMRDPSAKPFVGDDWAASLGECQLKDSMVRVLQSCLSPRAEDRPADASVLSDILSFDLKTPTNRKDDSAVIRLRDNSAINEKLHIPVLADDFDPG